MVVQQIEKIIRKFLMKEEEPVGLNVTMLEIGIGLILMSTNNGMMPSKHNSWLTSSLQWFGRNSYEVYLTHMFVVIFLSQLLGKQVVGCINLGTRNIGGFTHEFLLVGFPDKNKSVCLVTVDPQVLNGEKLF